ncbi:hypothetical protein J4E05_18835 [Thalassospira sp. NFXS8]|uniref:hypothetical protein n=1 Tax=Thalassospira sp. NFXS8 TaxID=2819093 RepID=UPI0032E0334C
MANNSCLQPAYAAVNHICHIFARPAFYEMSDSCNLKCEGCYFFDPGTLHAQKLDSSEFDEKWNALLAQEKLRGVTMPYFLGAEPALEQKRLLVAKRYFRRGNLGTNGTIRLDPEIPFRISISAWAADEKSDSWLRGASALRKALRLYQGDKRAILLYTVNPTNIDQVSIMARIARDHGLPLTFNLWSPTESILSRLSSFNGNDNEFFRISTPENSLLFDDYDLQRTRDTLDQVIYDFPDTVIYSQSYNHWSTRKGRLYTLNPETNIAEDCGSRIIGNFRYYGMNLQTQPVKCCTAAVDCENCRLYSGGWSSHFSPAPKQIESLAGFVDWLETVLTIGKIFLLQETDPEAFVSGSNRPKMAMETMN